MGQQQRTSSFAFFSSTCLVFVADSTRPFSFSSSLNRLPKTLLHPNLHHLLPLDPKPSLPPEPIDLPPPSAPVPQPLDSTDPSQPEDLLLPPQLVSMALSLLTLGSSQLLLLDLPLDLQAESARRLEPHLLLLELLLPQVHLLQEANQEILRGR
ncbi:hypothetical protein BDY24DRAFT_225687 [Mrakia frigida]|uniref:uncharacterized protein n=1 Tax=Mrakia frigida TaxID=29902 RepID=UPI003FCC06FB